MWFNVGKYQLECNGLGTYTIAWNDGNRNRKRLEIDLLRILKTHVSKPDYDIQLDDFGQHVVRWERNGILFKWI